MEVLTNQGRMSVERNCLFSLRWHLELYYKGQVFFTSDLDRFSLAFGEDYVSKPV